MLTRYPAPRVDDGAIAFRRLEKAIASSSKPAPSPYSLSQLAVDALLHNY
ncbi:MAG TPA: hypothetical protein V6C85_08010 [Allocoleopsis sp.]